MCRQNRRAVRPDPAIPWLTSGTGPVTGSRSAASAVRAIRSVSPSASPASSSAQYVPERPKWRPGRTRGSRAASSGPVQALQVDGERDALDGPYDEEGVLGKLD